jgi:hypothetical protein
VQFCSTNSYFSNWRQAWAGFIANRSPQPVSDFKHDVAVNAPALPRWKARFFQAVRT